ncbi:MAG: hypothetical protein ACR2JJ_04010 [Sphingomicrobium sp.]
MSKKFSAARKRAFLTYLSQTGNQTISAERARVSRSWVCLHRSTDAQFDLACREAIAEAKERIKAAGAAGAECPRHSSFPRYHQGEELVVSGSNGRRVQVRRAKLSQWTARVEDRFLSVLAATCNVKAACRAVGLWPPSAYSHRKRWPDFARRWEQAIAIGACELECRLHETIRHHFDRELPEPQAPLRDITVMDAIRLLRMYRSRER